MPRTQATYLCRQLAARGTWRIYLLRPNGWGRLTARSPNGEFLDFDCAEDAIRYCEEVLGAVPQVYHPEE